MIGIHNPKVKLAVSLTMRKYRERHGLLLLEGERLIRQSLSFGARLAYVLAERERLSDAMRQELEAKGIEVLPVGAEVIRKIAQTQTPQGVVAVAYAAMEDAVDLAAAETLIVLDRIQDPGNLGTILRAAAAVGVSGAILTEGTVDPKNPKAVRASAGAYFRVPLSTGWKPSELSERLGRWEIRLVAADSRGGLDAFAYDWRGKWALVMGNEGNGLDPSLKPTHRVFLPMPGGIESLNVGVAASVLLYEAYRRRRDG